MNTVFASKVLLAVVMVGLAGCSGMKTLEQDVADLKSQVAKLQGDVQSARAAADAATASAQSAGQAASGAQNSANQAVAAAQSSQACCSALDQKLERAFRQAVSK